MDATDVVVFARLVERELERVALVHTALGSGGEVDALAAAVHVVGHGLVVRPGHRLARFDRDVGRIELNVLHGDLGAAAATTAALLLSRGAAARATTTPVVIVASTAGDHEAECKAGDQ